MAAPRLVLFGAGATYGSSGIVPCSPPLGKELFPVLRRAFPASWGSFSEDLEIAFREHFEIGMIALLAKYPKAVQPLEPGAPSPHALMQDLARFFLTFELAPGYGDSYSRFLIALLQSPRGLRTRFATLNYEHLLERAMIALSLNPAVLRPHGGCQLWPVGGGQILSDPTRAFGQGLHSLSSRVKSAHSLRIMGHLSSPESVKYPCMAMYMPGKVTQIGQRYLWRIQARFRRLVHSSRTLVLIGVCPWPADDHLWRAIFSTRARVLYVGGTDDYEKLTKGRGGRETLFIAKYFDEAIDDLVAEM